MWEIDCENKLLSVYDYTIFPCQSVSLRLDLVENQFVIREFPFRFRHLNVYVHPQADLVLDTGSPESLVYLYAEPDSTMRSVLSDEATQKYVCPSKNGVTPTLYLLHEYGLLGRKIWIEHRELSRQWRISGEHEMIVAGMDFLKSFNLRLYPAGNRIELIPIAHISLQEDQSRQKGVTEFRFRAFRSKEGHAVVDFVKEGSFWQDFYKDHRLRTLIREGLERNIELETARLRIEEAIASLRVARGLLRPSATMTAEGNISSFEGANPDKTYSIGTTVSWEADIVGKQRNAVKRVMANVEEREAYRQLVQTRLTATIAQSYYTLEMLDAKRKVLQETIESWQQQILVMQALMEAGEAERGSIAQAEASSYEAQTQLEQINKQRFETEGALSVLLGRTPNTIDRGSFSTQDFSYQLVHNVPITALSARPDVRQAEAALRAAFYQVNVARSAFYPSLRLSGTLGWTNNGGAGIVNPGGILLQTIASLAQPLFANGQNRANLAIAQSQYNQALVQFSQTLLEAGNEVNNALKAYHAANNQTQLQKLQIEKLQQAVDACHGQMLYGDGNALQIIVVRQSLLTARLQQLSSEYEQIENYITLFRALGGGR